MLTCYDFAMAAALKDLLHGRSGPRPPGGGVGRRPRAGDYFISSRRSR